MERLTYRDLDGRALLTNKGMKIYCSTQATADMLCKYEELLGLNKPSHVCLIFSEENYSLIQQYRKEIKAVSDEMAVLNAICLALDNTD